MRNCEYCAILVTTLRGSKTVPLQLPEKPINHAKGRPVNKEERFDRLVGLIYDTAHDANDVTVATDANDANDANGARAPDAVIDAIRVELGELRESHEDTHGLMRRLAPHIERSGNLRSRIRQLQVGQAIQQIELAHLPFGLVWVGTGLQVVIQNARAGALLKPGSGIWVENNRLKAWVQTDMERLDLALHNALRAEERKGILLALRRRDQPVPLLASVIPVMPPPDGAVGPGQRFALVILQNPDEAAIGLAHLQRVYGFTAAECKLAEALLANDTLDSYGERTGVRRSTLRSHLAHLFKKTGTCRQSELVRLLMLAQPRV